MALLPKRNAHFEKMNYRGAKGKPWASFFRHLPRETLISTDAAPPQHHRSTGTLKAPESASGGRGGVFINKKINTQLVVNTC
jgi:hypothetical protein